MPIPMFDANLVLPPHLSNPTDPAHLSPYPCTSLELCERFGTTAERKSILGGFLKFRAALTAAGFTQGFQWLDGSFLEDIETQERRHPKDLDLVTFYLPPDGDFNARVAQSQPALIDWEQIKNTYYLDHYLVDISCHPMLTVEFSRYWVALFSHRRDGVWKGMLKVPLNTAAVDADAINYLGRQP